MRKRQWWTTGADFNFSSIAIFLHADERRVKRVAWIAVCFQNRHNHSHRVVCKSQRYSIKSISLLELVNFILQLLDTLPDKIAVLADVLGCQRERQLIWIGRIRTRFVAGLVARRIRRKNACRFRTRHLRWRRRFYLALALVHFLRHQIAEF